MFFDGAGRAGLMLAVTAAITAGALAVLVASYYRLVRTDLSVNPLVKRIAATANDTTVGDADEPGGGISEPTPASDDGRDPVSALTRTRPPGAPADHWRPSVSFARVSKGITGHSRRRTGEAVAGIIPPIDRDCWHRAWGPVAVSACACRSGDSLYGSRVATSRCECADVG